MATHLIAIFGHGLTAEHLDAHTKERVDSALRLARDFLNLGEKVVLVFAAGSGRDKSPFTMASVMETYALDTVRGWEHGGGVSAVTNVTSPEVWGTVMEMEWVHRVSKLFRPPPDITFVTNGRHARRACLANAMITKIPNCNFVHSSDDPPRWYHEVLGYLKVFAYVIGVERFAERFRRKYWAQ